MVFDKSSIAVDAFSAAIQEGLGIDFSPIVYNSDRNSNRRYSFILDRT